MKKNGWDISSIIIYSILIIAAIALVVIVLSQRNNEQTVESEIIAYLREDTEDSGDHVILLEECSSCYSTAFPKARFYYAWMTDADGDTEMLVVRYNAPGEIEAFEVWWEAAP